MAGFAELRARTGIARHARRVDQSGGIYRTRDRLARRCALFSAPASPETTAGLERSGTVGAAARPQ